MTSGKRLKRKQILVLHTRQTIDDIQGDEGLCNVFKDRYDHLYNSVSYDEAEMKRSYNQVSQHINYTCHTENCKCNHTIGG